MCPIVTVKAYANKERTQVKQCLTVMADTSTGSRAGQRIPIRVSDISPQLSATDSLPDTRWAGEILALQSQQCVPESGSDLRDCRIGCLQGLTLGHAVGRKYKEPDTPPGQTLTNPHASMYCSMPSWMVPLTAGFDGINPFLSLRS
jgi:hypothetical protein